jgi:hypothetical protein
MGGHLPYIYTYKPVARMQLEKATRIGKLRLGNAGSAFVEVLVGQSAWPPNTEYKVRLSSHVHHGTICTALAPARGKEGGFEPPFFLRFARGSAGQNSISLSRTEA